MKGLSLKLKGRLFSAFVLSGLLYNSEVWVIGKKGDEGSSREGCILHEEGSGREGEKRGRGRATVKPTIEGDAWYVKKMIRKRRLHWVAHSARRGQSDFTWKGMRRETEDEKSGWVEQIRIEWNEMGVEGVDHWTDLEEDRGWLRRTLGGQ